MCIAHVNRVSRQIRATLDPGAYRMDKLFALVEEAIPDPLEPRACETCGGVVIAGICIDCAERDQT